MTSFEGLGRPKIARDDRRTRASAKRRDPDALDDPAAPEIEDLGGATRASSGFDRRAAVAIAVVGALVTLGFAGRMAGPAAPSTPASTVIPAAIDTPAPLRVGSGLELLDSSAASEPDGRPTGYRFRADRSLGAVQVTIGIGRNVLGLTRIDIGAPGTYAAEIPVGIIPFPIDATLRVTRVHRGADALLAVPVRLEPSVALSVSAIRFRSDAGTAGSRLAVDGFASTPVDDLRLAIVSERSDPITTASAAFSGDPIGWGGVLLGGRPFSASLDASALRPGVPIRLVLTWTDSTTGRTESIERLLVPPQRATDTIATDAAHLVPTEAED